MDLAKIPNLASAEFARDKWAWYEKIREEQPVLPLKISVIGIMGVARFEDCAEVLKDPRLIRNRSIARGGGGRTPFPVPPSLKPLMESMIQADNPDHKRLRELVRRAFRPQAIAQLESRIEDYSHELLDGLERTSEFELQSRYAIEIPTRMISDMMGVSHESMPHFRAVMNSVTSGFSGIRVLKTLMWDLPKSVRYCRELIDEKRRNPGEDILTALLEAEHEGDRLSEDEIVAMVFLLIVAGFETTVHLITNGALTLLQHPDALARLRAEPELWNSAVEEILRHRGPIQGTKPNWAVEDLEIRGVRIPRGTGVMPLLAAANHDPRAFDDPQTFDVARSPNHHLGFGHGIHYCLGAHLARSETRIALRNLFERFPDLHLAGDAGAIQPVAMPGWHRYARLDLATRAMQAAA